MSRRYTLQGVASSAARARTPTADFAWKSPLARGLERRAGRRKTMKRTCLALAFVLGLAPLALADSHTRDDSALTRETAGAKFGRGFMEMITGFLEFPGNIYAETRD